MSKVFIIAEAGVNHNGQLDLALKLCDVSREAGVDAVKFQTFKTEKLLTKTAIQADYQKKNARQDISQFEMIKQLELSYQDFERIKAYCDDIGLLFLSTPDEEESLDFLVSLGVKMIKVGSGEVTNIPFLRKIGGKKREVILSTGMSFLGEVERAYYTLLEAGAPSVSLLHCTTNYPCPPEEANLKAILTLKSAFQTRVGYSDHTLGTDITLSAVALGAEIIEKHFTLDAAMPGPDHKASLDPELLKQLVWSVRMVESALGDGIKKPRQSELTTKRVVQKSIVAAALIKKGDIFSENNCTVKRIGGTGISAADWDMVMGRRVARDFSVDEAIELA